jgi:hypothetical protein
MSVRPKGALLAEFGRGGHIGRCANSRAISSPDRRWNRPTGRSAGRLVQRLSGPYRTHGIASRRRDAREMGAGGGDTREAESHGQFG